MKFYARFVAVCNICFIIAGVLRLVELNRRVKGNFDGAIGFQPLESTLVILGYGAVFFNLVFVLWLLDRLIRRRPLLVPKWLAWFNLMMFPLEIYYFLFT
ncbi:MAG: hypothetical protein ABIT96_08310 [Ferruginibacter sp.]